MYVIGRIGLYAIALCKKAGKGQQKPMSREEASKIGLVANERQHDWIKKSIYHLHEKSIARKMEN